jgi:hypothetical protein
MLIALYSCLCVSQLCAQVVIMLYEDPTKEQSSEERFHVELHFSPGVNCCVEKDLPPGPGFRPHSRNKEQVSTGFRSHLQEKGRGQSLLLPHSSRNKDREPPFRNKEQVGPSFRPHSRNTKQISPGPHYKKKSR